MRHAKPTAFLIVIRNRNRKISYPTHQLSAITTQKKFYLVNNTFFISMQTLLILDGRVGNIYVTIYCRSLFIPSIYQT